MRFLGGLGLLASVAFIVVLLAAPFAVGSQLDSSTQSALSAVAAATIAVLLTVLIVLFYVITQPTQAGQAVQDILSWLRSGASIASQSRRSCSKMAGQFRNARPPRRHSNYYRTNPGP